jgi:L,D-peptidoglycan transpeptidase YkuD (ErfK/YbiS/YcfS/YnhG family)
VTGADLVVTRRGLRFRGQYYPCSVGRTGLTSEKAEGDRATPRGTHLIVGCLYRPDRMSPPNSWAMPILHGHLWSDDPADAAYNHFVKAPYIRSHERLRRADPLYDLVLLTNWNWPLAKPGGGSAIFVHSWRKPGHPTEGCVALRPMDLRRIAATIMPGTKLRIG